MRPFRLLLLLLLLWNLGAPQVTAAEQESTTSSAGRQTTTDAEIKMESEIQAAWKQFLSAAEKGDTSTMLEYIAANSPAANTIASGAGPRLQQIARDHKDFGVVDFYLPYAECVAQIKEPEGDALYPVWFVRIGTRWLISSL